MGKRRTVTPARASGLLLISVGWALILALSGSPEAILFTIPLFLLAAPLAFGRYVGEEALAALRNRRPRAAATRPVLSLRPLVESLASRLGTGDVPVRGPPLASV